MQSRLPHFSLVATAAILVSATPSFAATRTIAASDMSMPGAAPSPAATPDGRPTAAERPFVAGVMADLAKRFPTAASAEAAGYLRYTLEDDTGAISYANRTWTSVDPRHPSQLWYDVKGRLLGADFSVLRADSPKPPQRWGVDPARWGTFPAHVHLGLKGPDGKISYAGVGAKTMTAGGGTLASPTPEELVKAGVAPDVAHVAFVFAFPAIWDLTVWVRPNPAGAFANANPNVHAVNPTKDAG